MTRLNWLRTVLLIVTATFAHTCSAFAQQPSQVRTASASATVPKHPLQDVLRIAKTSRKAFEDNTDYTCQFTSREVVNGKLSAHSGEVKFREKPMSVYLRFGGQKKGSEVLYVHGQNQGKILAHKGTGLASIVGTIALLPNSPRALSASRYPITRFGVKNMIDGIIKQWERDAKFAASETNVKYYPSAKLGNVECQVVETSHPYRRREFPMHMTRLYIDKKTQWPVRLEQYGYPRRQGERPPLLEEYTFWNITPSKTLSDRDFDPRNPAYRF